MNIKKTVLILTVIGMLQIAPLEKSADILTITVDMSNTQGEAMHGATGFLYGMGSRDSPNANLLTTIKPYNSVQKAPGGLSIRRATHSCRRRYLSKEAEI